jgi:hypothetical protein
VLLETAEFEGDVADLDSLDLREDLGGDLVLQRRLQVRAGGAGRAVCGRAGGGEGWRGGRRRGAARRSARLAVEAGQGAAGAGWAGGRGLQLGGSAA